MAHCRFRILDGRGRPLPPNIEQTLLDLAPRFQREFPAFRDDLSLVEVLEEAGRKIVKTERASPIVRLHAYAWVTLRSVASSRLRRLNARLEQRTLTLEDGETAAESLPAKFGTAEEIERHILLREVLSVLTPEERLVCIWKMRGFTSEEIASRRGGTAVAVDTLLSRSRLRVRRLLNGASAHARSASIRAKPPIGTAPRSQVLPRTDSRRRSTRPTSYRVARRLRPARKQSSGDSLETQIENASPLVWPNPPLTKVAVRLKEQLDGVASDLAPFECEIETGVSFRVGRLRAEE
jgi:DNA-directed RNA polymerase specialized sigma24 family protein